MVRTSIQSGPARVLTSGSCFAFVHAVGETIKVEPIKIAVYDGDSFLFNVVFKVEEEPKESTNLRISAMGDAVTITAFRSPGTITKEWEYPMAHKFGTSSAGDTLYISFLAEERAFGMSFHYTIFAVRGSENG